MTARYFCDSCGVEIRAGDRVWRVLGDLMVEIIVRYKGTWNGGHICENYVIRVVGEGRPAGADESGPSDQMSADSVE